MKVPAAESDGAGVAGASDVSQQSRDAAVPGNGSKDAARAMDAARADRPSDAKPRPDVYYPPVVCAENLLFCEDFEGGALDPARWQMDRPDPRGGSIQIDTTNAWTGKRSLHLKIIGSVAGSHASVQTIKKFPVTTNNLNIRVYIYMDKVTPSRFTPIVSVANFANGGPQVLQMDVIPSSETKPDLGPVHFFYELTDPPRSPVASAGDVPPDRWACWEMELVNQKQVNFYLDGVLIPGLTMPLSASFQDFDLPLWLGAYLTHDDVFKHADGFNLWIDDVAVSDKRIGCAP